MARVSAAAFISATICFIEALTAAVTTLAFIGWIGATNCQTISPIVMLRLTLLPVDRVFTCSYFAGETPFFTVVVVSAIAVCIASAIAFPNPPSASNSFAGCSPFCGKTMNMRTDAYSMLQPGRIDIETIISPTRTRASYHDN